MLRSSLLAIPILCLAAHASAGASVEALTTTEVATGLTRPVFVTHAPGDYKRLFIIEKQGRIRILDQCTGTLQSVGGAFLNIDSLVGGGTSNFDERGLLGLAFHPEYQDNGYFFVYYTNNASDTIVARYQRSTNDSANTSSATQVLFIDQPFSNHNGGWIAFGPNDGHLYIGTGDGGSGGDPGNRAQDITNQKLGKMLRINVDTLPYTIPANNPFVGETGDDEIWAYGLRNPWRNSFDPSNGDLFIADVGQGSWEEINVQRGVSPGGTNYGWKCREGDHVFSSCGSAGPFTNPVHEYSHSTGCSITGGEMYRGCKIPSLDGTYFFGDWCSDQIWSFRWQNSVQEFTNRTNELDPAGSNNILNISSFGRDAWGEIYVCDQNEGEVFQIVPVTPTISDYDFDCNGTVDVDDLVDVILNWGDCDGCKWDADCNGSVDVDELVGVILEWG